MEQPQHVRPNKTSTGACRVARKHLEFPKLCLVDPMCNVALALVLIPFPNSWVKGLES